MLDVKLAITIAVGMALSDIAKELLTKLYNMIVQMIPKKQG